MTNKEAIEILKDILKQSRGRNKIYSELLNFDEEKATEIGLNALTSLEQAEMPALAKPWGEYDEEDYNAGINACKPYLVKLKHEVGELEERMKELEDRVIRTEKVAKLQSLDEDAVKRELHTHAQYTSKYPSKVGQMAGTPTYIHNEQFDDLAKEICSKFKADNMQRLDEEAVEREIRDFKKFYHNNVMKTFPLNHCDSCQHVKHNIDPNENHKWVETKIKDTVEAICSKFRKGE